jgi:hypothetical protein
MKDSIVISALDSIKLALYFSPKKKGRCGKIQHVDHIGIFMLPAPLRAPAGAQDCRPASRTKDAVRAQADAGYDRTLGAAEEAGVRARER